ncbi:hypothetical protein DXG01_011262 [Tephrocybe rancida]|nr:hypothetical protein DXG01_011262 [Tephrocybe rancida]
MWNKPGKPCILKVTTKQLGFLVPLDHELITSKLHPPTFVVVLDNYYAGQWSIQSVALPIPILANPQGA